MYRNVFYRCDKSTSWRGEIWYTTWDDDGNPYSGRVPHTSYLYFKPASALERGDGSIKKYKTLQGDDLEVKYFDSVFERSRWIKDHPNTKIYGCLPPEREFLIENFEGRETDASFSKFPLRVQFVDIECPAESEFPLAEKALYPITLITVHDSLLNEYHVWSLKDFKIPDGYNNIVKHIDSNEKRMLEDWLNWQKDNSPDVISGWNIEKFDIPYLLNRCFRFFNEDYENEEESKYGFVASRISPVGQIKKQIKTYKGVGSEITTYNISGISILDYYMIYRYKFVLKSKPSWKLGEIAAEELNATKLSYSGTIYNFMKTDYDNFAKYNIIDVELCVKLDQKLRFIELSRTICNFGLVEYQAISKSQPYIYGILFLYSRRENMLLPSITMNRDLEDEQFEGAHVFEPKVGFYKHGIFSIDFNSLYPNIMISLNISPETKLGTIIKEGADFVDIAVANSVNIKRVTSAEFTALKKKVIISANNVIYCKHSKRHGVVSKFCHWLYERRVQVKAEMKRLTKLDDGMETKFQIEQLHNVQYAYKVVMNSLYGVMGNRYFPLYDLDNAMAVTLTGRALIKHSSEYVNKIFQDRYENSSVVLAGDTDSLYINAEPLLRKEFPDMDFDSVDDVTKACKSIDLLVNQINEEVEKYIHEEFNTEIATVQFKRETLCQAGCFLAKKRYVLYIRDLEGIPVKKFKYVGVEVKKNELPKKIKNILSSIIEGAIIEKWPNSKFQSVIRDLKMKYMLFRPDEIAFQKNYGTEKSSNGFLSTQKGAGAHARAVIYHNQLIEKLNIKNQEEEIFVDDRFRYLYVQPTTGYPIDVLAFKEFWLPEFGKYFMVDYETMFDKTVISPLKAFIKVFRWSEPGKFDIIDTVNLAEI